MNSILGREIKLDRGKIIAVSQTKGGAGKTTTIGCLAESLKNIGFKVSILDTDPNANMTNWWNKGQKNGKGFKDIELITENNEDDIIKKANFLTTRSDIVLIDVAGVGSRSLLYASGIADLVLIPAKPSEDDFLEAIKTKNLVENAQEMTGKLIPFRTFINEGKKKTIVLAHIKKQLARLELPIIQQVIYNRESYKQARFIGATPITLEPEGEAAKDYRAFCLEVAEIIFPEEKNQLLKA